MGTCQRRGRRLLTKGAAVLAFLGIWAMGAGATESMAAWLVQAAGYSSVYAESVPQGDVPFAVVSSRDVTVSWDQAELSSGAPVLGYRLQRYPSTSTTPSSMTSCTGVIATLTCTETTVPAGTWRYTITPVQGTWSGLASPYSSSVTVGAASLSITSSTTIPAASLPVALSGTIANYGTNESLSYRLDSPTGAVLSGAPASAGPTGGTAVSVTIPAGTNDDPHSVFVVGGLGSVASASITIVDPPALSALQMFDTNKNGRVDQVVATFTETLATPYTAGTTGWTLANVPSGGTLSSVSVSGTAATLTLAEGAGAASTAVGSFTVALAATSGGIRDANGHRSSFAATAPVDKAAPALTAPPSMADSTANGKVDRLTMAWSEPIAAYSAGTAVWTLANVPSAGTLSSVTATTGSTATTLTLTEGAGAMDTSVGSFTVALAASATGIRDAGGNQTSFAATAPADGAKPVRVSQRGLDVNGNGKFDRVDVVFSEPLGSYSPSAVPWTMTSPPTGASIGSVTLSGSTASLNLVEGSTFTTAVGSWTIALVASATGVADPAGNQASYAAVAVTDAAAPAPLSLTAQDLSGNDGFIDRVAVVFSEPLVTYSAGTTPWTLTNAPSGSVLTGAARSTPTINLTLGNPTGAADTSVSPSFTVALAANASGVRDAAGNLSSFSARTPIDGARPVPVSLSGTSGATPGKVEPGDTVSVLLSEPLAASVTVASPITVTLADPSGNGSDTLALPGIYSGARSTGSNSYVSTDASTAAFASSSVAVSADRKTITVTVGPSCAGTGCAGLGTPSTAANVSVLLDPALLDAAGNAPTVTARNVSFRLF